MEFLKDIVEIAEALLACLGGLKVLARYTKTKADDKILAAIEKPLAKAVGLVKKIKKDRKA